MSVALRSSPIEDSIPYKTVMRSRQPKDRKPDLPPSYWRRPIAGGCTAPTATGDCCQQIVRFGLKLCYYHEKLLPRVGRAALIVPMNGSLYITNGTHDKMPPQREHLNRPSRGRPKGAASA